MAWCCPLTVSRVLAATAALSLSVSSGSPIVQKLAAAIIVVWVCHELVDTLT